MSALADDPRRVVFTPPACGSPPFDVGDFLAILRIELVDTAVETTTQDHARSSSGADAWLSLSVTPCEGTRVNVEYRSPGHRPTRREVELADVVPRGRARALALAAAESVRSATPDVTSPEAPPPPSPTPPRLEATPPPTLLIPSPPPIPPQPATPPSSPTRDDRQHTRRDDAVQLDAALVLRTHPDFPLALVGGRVGMNLSLGRWPLRARADGLVLSGGATDPLGDVKVLSISGGASLAVFHAWQAFVVELGPHVELGSARVTGRNDAPTTRASAGSAFVAAGSIMGVISVPLAWRLHAEMRLELGETFRGVDATADARKVAGIDGPFLGVSLGLACSF